MPSRTWISAKGRPLAGDVVSLIEREAEGLISRHGQIRQCHVIMDGGARAWTEAADPVMRIVLTLTDCTLVSRFRVAELHEGEVIEDALVRAFEKAESLLDRHEDRELVARGGARPLLSF